LVATLGVLVEGATASPPKEGAANFVITGAVTTDVKQAGGNTIAEQEITEIFSGTMSGPVLSHARFVIHERGINYQLVSVCAPCDVEGRVGTLLMRGEGRAPDIAAPLPGRFTIVDSDGGLETLRGHGTFTGTLFPPIGTYSLEYHFEPA